MTVDQRSVDAGHVTDLIDPIITDVVVQAPSQQPQGWRANVRQTLRDARDFKALAASPYGLAPALTLAMISFFQRFDTAAFNYTGPEIARDLEINVGDIITIQILVGTVGIFAAIVAGYYADRHRRVPLVIIGTILSGIFSGFTGFAQSFRGVATPRVIDDVSEIASSVPRFSLLADWYPPTVRGKVFALLGTLANAGALLVPIVMGTVVVTWGWRWAYMGTAIPLTIAGVVAGILLWRREPVRGYFEKKAMGASEEVASEEDEPQSFGEAWRTVWGVRTVRRLVVADIFSGAGASVVGLYFLFFSAEKYGLNALERGLTSLPAVVAAVFGGFIGGGLVDRFTRENPSRVLVVIGTYSLIGAFAPIIFIFEPPLLVIVVASIPLGFGAAMIGPASSVVYAQVIPPRIRTQGLQISGLSALGAVLVGLPIARVIFGEYGYGEVFLFSVPLAIVGGIIAMTSAKFFELDMRTAFRAAMADEEWRRAKASGTSKLLVCRGIDVHYGGVQVLFDVDFDVEEGEIIALLGTNGAGKSTLLRAISGIAQASGGAIVFDGRDITYMPPHEIVARGVVHMPGGRGVFPELSVRENLLLANWLTEDPEEIAVAVAEVLDIFPKLRGRLDVPAGQLSGGEQQHVALAQALLSKPKLLCIDELSLGLSPTAVAELLDVVRELHRRGITIVVVEQSINVALSIAHKAVFMEKGEIRFIGETAELLERPDILRSVFVKGVGSGGGTGPARRSGTGDRALALGEARPVLEVEGITKHYGGVAAVHDVSFTLHDGETLGLIGPNGAGKTTIFDLISGFQSIESGVVRLDGVDITEWSPDARAREGLIRRFQDARLFPGLSVEETLLMSLERHLEVRNTVLHGLRVPQARRAEKRLRARADRLLELFELGSMRDKFVRELSTGLRRIVDLACVMAAEPKVLLLDEPSSGIAQAETENLGPVLRRVRYETGASILIIEHDMPLISKVSDELIALELGQVVLQGPPREVLEDPRVIEAYLGTDEATISRSGVATGTQRAARRAAPPDIDDTTD
ncbi:MAG: MFS transporter [Microthrixaceae bacterium]